jgi:hypothetical protein
MTTLLLERSPAFDEGFECDAQRRLDDAFIEGTTDAHGRLTLDDLITGVWEGLAVRGTVDCPVCGSRMASRSVAISDEAPVAACHSCGSHLS